MVKFFTDITQYMPSAKYSTYCLSPFGLRTAAHRDFIISQIPKHFGYQPVPPDLPLMAVDEVGRPAVPRTS